MATTKLLVQDQSAAVKAMAVHWPMLEALMGGTKAMRERGMELLPKWPNEDHAAYAVRLNSATLFPAFERTVGVMAGKPFSKELTLDEKVPPRLVEYLGNCDLQGRNFHAFLSELLRWGLGFGLAGVLVEVPKRPDGVISVADERRANLRPYLVLIKHNQILGWKSEIGADGALRLSQLRLLEAFEKSDGGAYGTVVVKRVRVLERGRWQLFEEQSNGSYLMIEEGITAPVAEIPFVPFYGFRESFMVGKPPLLNLAYQNVEHWQSKSDQQTLLHVARVPILVAKGVEDSQDQAGNIIPWELTIGASTAIRVPENGDLKWVEHTGKAIESGAKSLEQLEAQMVTTGAELLIPRPDGPAKSATEDNNDVEANKSDLQRIVEGFEDSADQVLQFMAEFMAEKDGGQVSLFKDFGSAFLTSTTAALVLQAQAAGLISKKTAVQEMQRHGVLSPDLDPEQEIEDAQADGPPLGTVNDPQGNGGNS
jgi:hypothetical protein